VRVTTVAIAGASGVVGTRVLGLLLAREEVRLVVAVGRRVLPGTDEKVVSRVVVRWTEESLASELPDRVGLAVSCLGTTMKQAGSKGAFRAVDHDAVVAFAAAALARGARRFLLVSSIGASARSGSFYLRTKGETEEALARLGYPQLTILRPSFIDDQGARREFRLGERVGLPLARAAFAVLGRRSRYAPIPADVIARALVRLAFDETDERVRVVESDRLHAAGSPDRE
jgi:uncharacterized protein YbjT (DUF2867 family)